MTRLPDVIKLPISLSIPFRFPEQCSYCCAPATQFLNVDARVDYTWQSFTKPVIKKTKVGGIMPIPYCSKHYEKALIIRQRLVKYSRINEYVKFAFLIACLVLVAGILYALSGDLMLLLGGIFAGFLAWVFGSFIFDPLFGLLTGTLFSRSLENILRSDLKAHIEAQNKTMESIFATPYTLGLSIHYKYEGSAGICGVEMCFTNSKYAEMFGRLNSFRSIFQNNSIFTNESSVLYKPGMFRYSNSGLGLNALQCPCCQSPIDSNWNCPKCGFIGPKGFLDGWSKKTN